MEQYIYSSSTTHHYLYYNLHIKSQPSYKQYNTGIRHIVVGEPLPTTNLFGLHFINLQSQSRTSNKQ